MIKIFKSKKFKLTLVWVIFILIFSAYLLPVLAQTSGPAEEEPASQTSGVEGGQGFLDVLKEVGGKAGLTYTDPIMVIVKIINYLLTLIGVVFMVIIIYGGILWMTAGGNEEKTKKAKDLIKAAAWGLVIVILARVLYSFIIQRLNEANKAG